MSTMTTSRGRSGYVDRPGGGTLADVINIILDKGLVLDAYVRVSLVGIEVLTIDARIVIASVDTYLRFAEATNRLSLEDKSRDLPELMEDLNKGGARGKTSGLLQGAKEAFTGSDDEDEDDKEQPRRRQPERQRRRSGGDSG